MRKHRKHLKAGKIIFSTIVFFLLCSNVPLRAADNFNMESMESAGSAVAAPVISRPKVEYSAQGLRDPFQGFALEEAPVQSSEEFRSNPLPALTVQGIMWGGKLIQAIINNKVVAAGDIIEGVKIVKINKEGVTVFFEGRQFTITAPATGGVKKEKP